MYYLFNIVLLLFIIYYLLLDDINVAKCTKIVEEIKSEPTKWEIIEENKTTRNGFLVCKNLNNC